MATERSITAWKSVEYRLEPLKIVLLLMGTILKTQIPERFPRDPFRLRRSAQLSTE
jgi:hypothetical protein